MAHESHYSSQFLLGVNPLMQGLEMEAGNSGLLGIEMLEPPSSTKLLESANTAASAWLLPEYSSPMSLFEGSTQTSMKLSLSLLNTKPPSALQPEFIHHHQQQRLFFDLKNSMHLRAARELLIECCSLEGGRSSNESLVHRTSHWEHLERPPTASYSMNHMEFHSLKTKLFSMLEEVEKRYSRYCEQMQVTVSMLESVAGEGAAKVYTSLASKAMSRHFRRLKDGIVGQLKAGEIRDDGDGRATTTAGMTRGETPRLRLLDQCVQQQKALQQGMAHQQLPWRPQRGLPEHAVSILRAWLFEHFLHPYPSDVDKIILARQSGLSRSQVSNWFINARVRIWKPMVEEMYTEEMNELDSSNHHINAGQNTNPKPPSLPTQLLNVDSGSLSSIVINGGANHGDDESSFLLHRLAAPGKADGFDLPTSYSNFAGDSLKSSVSLTLGLHQEHAGGGIKAPHHRLF